MRVNSDWYHRWTAEKAEEQLTGFVFKGSGLYLSKTDTLLVVPDTYNANAWKQNFHIAIYQ